MKTFTRAEFVEVAKQIVGDLVHRHRRAIESHANSIDVPAPVSYGVIDDIARNHGAVFQIAADGPPEVTLEGRLAALETYFRFHERLERLETSLSFKDGGTAEERIARIESAIKGTS